MDLIYLMFVHGHLYAQPETWRALGSDKGFRRSLMNNLSVVVCHDANISVVDTWYQWNGTILESSVKTSITFTLLIGLQLHKKCVYIYI